jgi:16S rRNA (guanine527-N7)-methyltransferase
VETARIAELLAPFLASSPVEESPLAELRIDKSRANDSRINAAQLDLVQLNKAQVEQVSVYIDLLLRWNRRINLTAIRTPEEIVTRHFGESFFLAHHVVARTLLSANPSISTGNWQLATGNRALDIGSGAGFPALPLKIWAPHIHLTLIESNHKKTAFLREVIRTLSMTKVNVLTDRAEILAASADHPQAEIVTLRAVERFETILPQAAAFVAPQGCLALLIGSAQLPKLASLTRFKWQPSIYVPKSHSRLLIIGTPT